MTLFHITQQYEIPLDPSLSFPLDSIAAIAFHEPADVIVLGYESGRVAIVRKSPGSIVRTLHIPSSDKTPVKAAAISPDGKQLAVCGSHHTVERWNMPSLTMRGRYDGHQAGIEKRQGTITSLAWSPDSVHMASGSSDGSLHIWNARSLHHLGTFVERGMNNTPVMPVTALAWSPSGALLADATTGMLRIWDTSGHLRRSLEISPQGITITALTWVCDETKSHDAILFAHEDGTVQLCSVANGACFTPDSAHSCMHTIQTITWSARQQQGHLAYEEKNASGSLLHVRQFSFL